MAKIKAHGFLHRIKPAICLLAVSVLLTAGACSASAADLKISSEPEGDVYGAGMSTAYFTVINSGKRDVEISNTYAIEYETDDGKWEEAPIDYPDDDSMAVIAPEGSMSFVVSLHPEQYDYEPGKYRITKSLRYEGGTSYLYHEFEVK